MRAFLRSLALVMSCVAVPAYAQVPPVVVELYTSQGCSSCPPADEMLTELSARDDVIALALHVDYWDYIGWVDDFAIPANTQRQQAYARAAGETTIYTPQFVIAGEDIVIGARGLEVANAISKRRDAGYPIDVTLDRSGDTLSVTAETTDSQAAGPYVVQLAQIMPPQTVDVRRGENAGKSLTYSNVVRSLTVLEQWDGVEPLSLEADIAGASQVAVIIQRGTDGPVVGAAQLTN